MGVVRWRRGEVKCCSGLAGKCGGGSEQWSGCLFDRSQSNGGGISLWCRLSGGLRGDGPRSRWIRPGLDKGWLG